MCQNKRKNNFTSQTLWSVEFCNDRPNLAIILIGSEEKVISSAVIMMKTSSSDIESIPDIINLKQYNQLYWKSVLDSD